MQLQKFILILLLTVLFGCKTKNENNKVEPTKPTEIITQNNLPKDSIPKIDTTLQIEKEITLVDSSFTKKSNEDATDWFIRELKTKGVTEIFNYRSYSVSMVGVYEGNTIFWKDTANLYISEIESLPNRKEKKDLPIYTYRLINSKTLDFVQNSFYELKKAKLLNLEIKPEKKDNTPVIDSNGNYSIALLSNIWILPSHYASYSFEIHSIKGFISHPEVYNNSFNKYDNGGNDWTKDSKLNINYERNINSKWYQLIKLAEAEIDVIKKFIAKK